MLPRRFGYALDVDDRLHGQRPVEGFVDAETVLLWAQDSHNHFHFLLESLGRLLLFREFAPDADVYYLAGQRTPPQQQFLDLAGVSCDRVIEPTGHWGYRRLWAPSRGLANIVSYCPHVVHLLEQLAQSRPPLRDRSRLYISRASVGQRAVQNEDETWGVLRAAGFEQPSLEHMSAGEQIDAFRASAVVVAPHGAALANLTFAPSDCRILELQCEGQEDGPAAIFRNLAAIRGMTWGALVCPEVAGAAPRTRRNFAVDANLLQGALAHLIDG